MKRVSMKNVLVFIGLLLSLTACDSRKQRYMDRHSENYNSGNVISRKDNPDLVGNAEVYDAEDFRAGAWQVCNFEKRV